MAKKLSSKVKEDKIIQAIRNAPEGIRPISIASYTELNENTVKSCLSKLKRKGFVKIKGDIRGLYVLVENNHHRDIFDFKFQNLILTCIIPSCDREFESTDLIIFENMLKVNFGICLNTKKATLHLSSSYGLNMLSTIFVAHWFIDRIKFHLGVDVSYKDILVASAEFNKDYYNLRLQGATCITLDALIAQYKLYDNDLRVREELKTKISIPFPIFCEMLTHGPIYADISNRLDLHEKTMEKVIANQNRQISLINQLLDGIWRVKKVL